MRDLHSTVCCIHHREPQPRFTAEGERLITIARTFESDRAREAVPMIRMRGRWLEEFGFKAGKRIIITPDDNCLVLTVEEASIGRL